MFIEKIIKNKQRYKSFALTLLLIISILLSCKGFYTDIHNSLHYGGADFRNRVVGARLLEDGYDPYFFTWNEEYPEKYLDPNDRIEFAVTRVTVPPTVLMLHTLFSGWDYRYQRIFWFIVQWLSLLLSIYFFASRTPSKQKALLIWILALIFISSSSFWRFHVERGQIYIFYVFLLSCSYYVIGIKQKKGEFLSGIISGFTASLRPPVALIAVPAICFRRFSMLAGMAIGCIGNVGISIICFGTKPWFSYFKAMHENEVLHLNLFTGLVSTPLPKIPLVENMDIQSSFPFLVIDTSLQGVFGYLGSLYHSSSLFLWFSIFTVCYIVFMIHYKYKYSVDNELLFLSGILLVLISEFFVPAYRYTYNNIIWLIPLSLIIMRCQSSKTDIAALLFLLAGLTTMFINNIIMHLMGTYWVTLVFLWYLIIMFKRDNASADYT